MVARKSCSGFLQRLYAAPRLGTTWTRYTVGEETKEMMVSEVKVPETLKSSFESTLPM